MELKEFLKRYRKSKKFSVRKFAEVLGVSNFRLEKWEAGFHPNYEDSIKIKEYFGVKEIQNFSEAFLETFEPRTQTEIDEVIRMKDLLLEEKDKRIQSLEETIGFLKEAVAEYQTKNKR